MILAKVWLKTTFICGKSWILDSITPGYYNNLPVCLYISDVLMIKQDEGCN